MLTRRPLATSRDRPTMMHPRGRDYLPLQAAAARAASELGCRVCPSTNSFPSHTLDVMLTIQTLRTRRIESKVMVP